MSLTKGIQNQKQDLCTLEKFFKDFEYETPNYQRAYKWGKEQIDFFFEDIDELLEKNIELIENDDNNFFQLYFGSVMLTKDKDISNKFKIIDGQQRCITFILLLSAIKEKIKDELEKLPSRGQADSEESKKAETTFRNIKDLLFKKKISLTGASSGNKLKIHLFNTNDMKFLEKLVALSDITVSLRGNRIARNYELVKSGLNELLTKHYFRSQISCLERLNFIYDQIVNNIYLLTMTLNNEMEAFAIFESLNNKGLDLTPFDLINGFVETKLKNNKTLEEEWSKQILNYLGNGVPLDNYIFYWWQSIGKDTPQIELFNEIKKYINNGNEEKHIKEILNSFDLLYKFLNAQTFISQYFLLLKRKKIIPLYLALKNKNYTDEEINIFLTKVIKYSMIEMNLRGKSPGIFQYKAKSILRTVLDNNIKLTFEKVVSMNADIKNDIDTYDKKIFATIIDGGINDDQFMKCLYYMIIEKETKNDIVKPDFANIDIEHLFPQTPDKKWYEQSEWAKFEKKENEEEKIRFINMLGNMVLLNNKLNRQIQNSYIVDKKTKIDEKLPTTYFEKHSWAKVDYRNFNSDYIKARTKEVVKTIIEIGVFDFVKFGE